MRTIYGLRAQSGRVTWKKEGGSYYPSHFSRAFVLKILVSENLLG